MEDNIITYSDLHNIICKEMQKMSLIKLIETHKDLCKKSFVNSDNKLINCGSYFYFSILLMCYDEGFREYVADGFFKSKHVSEYVKKGIRAELEKKNVIDNAIDLLKSDKLLNDMSCSELSSIYSVMNDNGISTYEFLQTLFRLDGNGVKEFITKKEFNSELSSYILQSSGLSDRSSLYSGRGVNIGDLNSDKLLRMHAKLRRINPNYLVSFYDLIDSMPTLGATEFIESFQNFARRGFEFDEKDVSIDNYSLNRLCNDERYAVNLINVFMALSASNPDYTSDSFTRMIKRGYQGHVLREIEYRRLMSYPNIDKGKISIYLQKCIDAYHQKLFDEGRARVESKKR